MTDKDAPSEQKRADVKMTRTEYLRIIGFWGAIFALVIFTYQLGQWNALNIMNEIHSYCSNHTVANVGILGDVSLYQNMSHAFIAP